MKKTALVIMAAGIGSRFGKGIKQLAPVGPNGEIIMEYSIYDALEAGFNKVVFIIRKDLEEEFRAVIGNKIEQITEVEYAFQSLEDLPDGFEKPADRTKPWGTGQAVLSCKGKINEPFVVINADDYYGKEAFVKIKEFLEGYDKNSPEKLCMAGFVLKNTLSDNGGVTRGVCRMDDNGYLTAVDETPDIVKTETGASANGVPVDAQSLVSMNMWGLTPEFIDVLEDGFIEFFNGIEKGSEREMKAEYLLPIYIDELLKKGKVSVKVLKTSDKWFGVTYKEDKPAVVESFGKLIEAGVYKEDLFSDLG